MDFIVFMRPFDSYKYLEQQAMLPSNILYPLFFVFYKSGVPFGSQRKNHGIF